MTRRLLPSVPALLAALFVLALSASEAAATAPGVSWGAHSTPATMAAGAVSSTNVSFTNTGTTAWPAGGANPVRVSYHWRSGACPGGSVAVWDGRRAALSADVPPGGSVSTLAIGVLAPSTTGTYCLAYDLVQEGSVWFSLIGNPTLPVTVNVTAPPLGVAWGAHTTPPAMSAGASASATISFTNSGASAWQAGGATPVRLSYHWRHGSCPGSSSALWDGLRANLSADVPAGGAVSNLPIAVRAPSAAGPYCLVYDLVKESVTWFSSQGASTLAVSVTVAAANAVTWGAHTTPSSMTPAALVSTTVSFTNSGGVTWAAAGATPVRLSYHWRNGACPGSTVAVWDGRRASLPGNVAPGSTVSNLAIGVQAPATPGSYCLIYDLVQEGVAWFSTGGAATLSVGVTVGVAANNSRIVWENGAWYLHGINMPWYNWSCDFGCGQNGGASDSDLQATFASRLSQLQANGVHVLRWWAFPGNPWQITRNAAGAPTGINPAVYADFDAALQLAETYDLYLVFTLFSGPSDIPGSWLTNAGQRGQLATVLGTLFARYNGHPRLLTWQVINEPEWDIWNGSVSQSAVQDLVRDIATSVHANSTAYVSVGAAMLDGLPLWKGLGLDYYTAHWYDYMSSGNWCARCTTYAEVRNRYGLDRPLVIGELYAAPAVDALQRFEDFYAKGYAGAFPWSLFPERTNDNLAVDLNAADVFAGRHGDIGP